MLGRLAAHVDTIERHRGLADAARATLEELGVANVDVHCADGTLGWPDGAPFDAIVAAAGGPAVPPAWCAQLAIGGRLVMPVGEERVRQHLVKLTRAGPDRFEEESLGAVHFVPLIGAQGWPETPDEASARDDLSAPPAPASAPAAASIRGSGRQGSVATAIRAAATPLAPLDDPLFAQPFDRYATKRVVLLGEATHGTSEFYRTRAAITRRLVERHGFRVIAVEADWPDAAAIDRRVRPHVARDGDESPPFMRFPRWMWRNREFAAFVAWLYGHNASLDDARRAAFYGLDLYSLSASVDAVLRWLERRDPKAARIARERYGCLTPWQKDPAVYAHAAITPGFAKCEDAVVAQLQDLLLQRLEGGAAHLDATQNARLIVAAERYYRTMYRGSAESWNQRDTHMFDTLCRLLDAHGPDARAVVWAHNSHVGDAAATEMGRVHGQLSVGQLCRERFGDDAALLGFGTHAGTVAAASDWDGPLDLRRVHPSHPDSYERQFHLAGVERCLVDLGRDAAPALRDALGEPRLERLIGVVYRPQSERHSHYVEATLTRQFDAFVWFDTTRAVEPLDAAAGGGPDDLFPSGL